MKFMFGLQHPLTCKPWTTLSNPCNKVRGKYICKEVFLCLPSCVISSCVCYHCVGMYPVYICIFLHESEDDYSTVIYSAILPPLFHTRELPAVCITMSLPSLFKKYIEIKGILTKTEINNKFNYFFPIMVGTLLNTFLISYITYVMIQRK